MDDWKPIVGFYFQVEFGSDKVEFDMMFSEVSGLTETMETEAVEEGGESRFTHQLPKRRKHENFVCKRALQPLAGSPLAKWVQETLEGDFTKQIETSDAFVSLLDETKNKVASWSLTNLYPIKWSLGALDSKKNDLAIETIEFAYHTIERKL